MAMTNGVASDVGGIEAPTHELDAPPWRRVETTLMATANAIRGAYDERLAPTGLTLSLASLLSYVADFGPVSQTRIAEHLDQGRAVTGTQIDRLEADGLLERRPCPTDRRVWLVAITSAGERVAADVSDVDRVLRADLRAGISRADRQTLAATLVRLKKNLMPPADRHSSAEPSEPTHPSDQRKGT